MIEDIDELPRFNWSQMNGKTLRVGMAKDKSSSGETVVIYAHDQHGNLFILDVVLPESTQEKAE